GPQGPAVGAGDVEKQGLQALLGVEIEEAEAFQVAVYAAECQGLGAQLRQPASAQLAAQGEATQGGVVGRDVHGVPKGLVGGLQVGGAVGQVVGAAAVQAQLPGAGQPEPAFRAFLLCASVLGRAGREKTEAEALVAAQVPQGTESVVQAQVLLV